MSATGKRCSIARHCYSPTTITASGIVATPGNNVTCQLQQLHATTHKPVDAGVTQVVAAIGTNWSVAFAGTYSGEYLLTASAPGETSASVDDTVGAGPC
jgi:hypothetical protein